MTILCALLLLMAAIGLLFFFDESEASTVAVAILLGLGLSCILHELLPPDFFEARTFRRRSTRYILMLLACSAACYKLVEWQLYPLRNRLMEAFAERWRRKG